jgi:hypothetical protein
LPDTIDWNKLRPQPHRSRSGLLFLIGIIAVLVFGGRTALSFWVDLLWFKSLGYAEVFWKARALGWGIFAAFFVLTFLILLGIFSALKHAHLDDLPSDHSIYIGGQEVRLSLKPVLRVVSIGGSLIVAALSGGAMAAEWQTLALWWYAPRGASGVTDPIFGRPLDFYLFTLPAWQLILGWLLTLSVIACVIAVVFLLVSGSSRALSGSGASLRELPWRGLSVAAAFLLLVVAMRVYLGRMELLFEHHTIFDGVTYTDAHVTLTGSLVVCAALLLGALIALFGGLFAPRGRWLVVAVMPAVVCYIAVGVVAWYVSSFLGIAHKQTVQSSGYWGSSE